MTAAYDGAPPHLQAGAPGETLNAPFIQKRERDNAARFAMDGSKATGFGTCIPVALPARRHAVARSRAAKRVAADRSSLVFGSNPSGGGTADAPRDAARCQGAIAS